MKFYHISDLHFHDRSIDQTHQNGGHNYEVLKALTVYLKKAVYDKLLITGDVTDWGSRIAFQNFKTWLTSEVSTSADGKIGLSLSADKYLIVPGNHDYYDNDDNAIPPRVIQAQGKNYYEYFSDSLPRIEIVRQENMAVVFFLLDSCFPGRLAAGRISHDDVKFITDTCNVARRLGIKSARDGAFLNPTEFRNACKIVILHHHIFRKKHQFSSDWLDLKDIQKALSRMFVNDFALAISGHKHIDYHNAIKLGDALDTRALRRFAFDLLAKQYSLTGKIRNYEFDSKQIGFIKSLAIEMVYKLEAMVGKERDMEVVNIEAGIRDFTKKALSDIQIIKAVNENILLIKKEIRKVLNQHRFSYLVGNTAMKQRGPSADYIYQNSISELILERYNNAYLLKLRNVYYDDLEKVFKEEGNGDYTEYQLTGSNDQFEVIDGV